MQPWEDLCEWQPDPSILCECLLTEEIPYGQHQHHLVCPVQLHKAPLSEGSRAWFNALGLMVSSGRREEWGQRKSCLTVKRTRSVFSCSDRCLELVIFLRELLWAPWRLPASPSLGVASLQTDVSLFQESAEALSTALRDPAFPRSSWGFS